MRSVAFVLSLLILPTAAGGSPVAEITIDRDDATIWTSTTVTDGGDEALRVKVLAPEPDGSLTLWQVCRFPSAEAGPYRCGIDRTTAEQRPGRWVVRALLEGDRIGRRDFWVG